MTLDVRLAHRASGPRRGSLCVSLLSVALLVAACTPAAPPSPTAAPAKQVQKAAATIAPAKPAATQAAAKPAEKPAAQADTKAIESFYKGKTIRIVVGSAPGGGFDTYARTFARHLGKHIPGNPNIIVENMPGAGSLLAANHVYNVAEKDGTVIGHPQGGIFLQQLLGLQGIEFDALKWQVLSVPVSDNNLCVASSQSGLKSLADVMNPDGKQFIAGGNAPGSATWDVPMRLKAALDLNLKMVEGYDGTAKVRLAMDQGEVDGLCGWSWESLRSTGLDRVQNGDMIILGQVTEKPIDDNVLANVPTAMELAKTDEARQLIRLGIIIPSQILRTFLVSPEVPAERVQALRQAFDSTLKDKEFLSDAEKAKLDIAPIPAAEGQKLIRDLFAMPESVKAKLKQINDRQL